MKFNVDLFLTRDENDRDKREDREIRLQGIKRDEGFNLPKIGELTIKGEDAI